MADTTAHRPATAALVAAFGAVWIIWGSTYLAIRYALETLPPFLFAGARFLIAGLILLAIAVARGAPRPTARQWRAAAIVGVLLFLGGNGAVVWAEIRIPSGPAALLVATEPLMIVLLQRTRPGPWHALGLLLGFAGVAILVGPAALLGGGALDPVACLVVVAGSLSWAAGSLIARTAGLPEHSFLSSSMQMLIGGAALAAVGIIHGDLADFRPEAVSATSLLAVAYLVVFGSLVAFTAYSFLVRHVSPGRVSTYAYINPVVAVVLGSIIAGEPFTPRIAIASIVIVAAVVMITVKAKPAPAQPAERPAPPEVRAADASADAA
jgi:drug/metabolite transporter (DMT)-like permease